MLHVICRDFWGQIYCGRADLLVFFWGGGDNCTQSRESVVCITTRLWVGHPRNLSWILGRGRRFSSSPECPDRLWGPPSLSGNNGAGAWNSLHQVPWIRTCGAIPLLPYWFLCRARVSFTFRFPFGFSCKLFVCCVRIDHACYMPHMSRRTLI
jgi:hypothetical protein